jgi:hypothetical protein
MAHGGKDAPFRGVGRHILNQANLLAGGIAVDDFNKGQIRHNFLLG